MCPFTLPFLSAAALSPRAWRGLKDRRVPFPIPRIGGMWHRLATFLSVLPFLSTAANAFPTCKSDSNTAVDTWFAIKHPKGSAYTYWDSDTLTFQPSKHSMNDTTVGALAQTLQQLWSSSISYLLWNDSPLPASPNYNYTTGHTKAVWMWNTETNDAVILQHSIPLFPAGPTLTPHYLGLGSNAWTYGQHAACLQTTVDQLAAAAALIPLSVPSIYDQRIQPTDPASLQQLAAGAASTDPMCATFSFQTPANRNITLFTKSTQWDNELYAECIAPTLQESLVVESRVHGSAEGPACNTLSVLDIKGLALPDADPFSEYDDHSKWALAASAASSWICPSDINRMTSQFARGGSAFCWKEPTLAAALRTAITSTDSCKF